jgi:hypothetical protein
LDRFRVGSAHTSTTNEANSADFGGVGGFEARRPKIAVTFGSMLGIAASRRLKLTMLWFGGTGADSRCLRQLELVSWAFTIGSARETQP